MTFVQEALPNCQAQDWIKSFLAVHPRIKSNIPRLWDIWNKAPQTISITTPSTVDFNHLFPIQIPQPDCKTLEARDHYTLCILLSLPCPSHSILKTLLDVKGVQKVLVNELLSSSNISQMQRPHMKEMFFFSLIEAGDNTLKLSVPACLLQDKVKLINLELCQWSMSSKLILWNISG